MNCCSDLENTHEIIELAFCSVEASAIDRQERDRIQQDRDRIYQERRENIEKLCRQQFQCCIVANTHADPTSIVKAVLPFLAPSASLAIYFPSLQPLVECLEDLKVSSPVLATHMHNLWIWRKSVYMQWDGAWPWKELALQKSAPNKLTVNFKSKAFEVWWLICRQIRFTNCKTAYACDVTALFDWPRISAVIHSDYKKLHRICKSAQTRAQSMQTYVHIDLSVKIVCQVSTRIRTKKLDP